MLFRDSNGKLIEISRKSFRDDNAYYNKLLFTKQKITKEYNQKNKILQVC